MGSLLVVTGPPGAGKSAVARLIVDRLPRSVLVEGDAFFAFLRAGSIEPWLPESDAQNGVVTEAAASAVGRFVRGGYNTVYDGVVGPWFLAKFAAATSLFQLDYVVLLPPVDSCVHRVATRTGHDFGDEAATRHMHEQFSRAQIASRHVLRAPPATVEAVAESIMAAQATGTLRYPSIR